MNVPATMAALGGDKVRWKLAELVTEALMVVFAVLVALGVEEWREERQLRAFADRARAAVDLEIRQNLDEFRRSRHGLIDGRDEVAQVLQALTEAQESGESGSVSAQFGFDFPDISTAAWRVAQASQAAPYFDYDWVIERARHYDSVDRYVGLEARFLEEISVGLGSATGDEGLDATVFAVRRIHGRLDIILQLHEGLQEDMEAYLGDAEPETEPE
jgi:hypothetical protein